MTDERWRRIEELCHQALALDAPARGAFLHDACGGDVELRRDTVSLLANETDARHFLEPDGPSTPLGPVLVGKRVGAYEILSLLGAGGMGEVYRARDTTLGRDVALKVLPAALSADADRLMLRGCASSMRVYSREQPWGHSRER